MRYSGFKIIDEATTGHCGGKPVWRELEPKRKYDIVVIGGGGHGLARHTILPRSSARQRWRSSRRVDRGR